MLINEWDNNTPRNQAEMRPVTGQVLLWTLLFGDNYMTGNIHVSGHFMPVDEFYASGWIKDVSC